MRENIHDAHSVGVYIGIFFGCEADGGGGGKLLPCSHNLQSDQQGSYGILTGGFVYSSCALRQKP